MGYVTRVISFDDERVRISLSNPGAFPGAPERRGNGLGLRNVQRRLAICYGAAADFRIEGDAVRGGG
jgi:LytS/YehU family sensor histidine kinase